MTTITDLARTYFYGPSGDPEANMSKTDGMVLFETIDGAISSQSAITYAVAAWVSLSAITGASEGVGAVVVGSDTGTHTDPVVGGVVQNAGVYSWSTSPAGWERIGDNYMSAASDAEGIAGTSTTKVMTPHADAAAMTARLAGVVSTETDATRDTSVIRPIATFAGGPSGVSPLGVNTKTGATAVIAIDDHGDIIRSAAVGRDSVPYKWWVEAASGLFSLAIDRVGRVWNRGFGDTERSLPPSRDVGPVRWGVVSGTKALAFIDHDGAFNYHKRAPRKLRDGRPISSPHDTDDFIIGTVADGGTARDVKQRRASVLAVAVPDDPRPLIYLPSYGQSNATRGGSYTSNPRKMTAALYLSSCLALAAGATPVVFWAGDTPHQASTMTDFAPLQDLATLQYPAEPVVAMAFGLEAAYRARGLTSPGIVAHCDAYGGEPLETFIKGTQVYTNLIAHATRAVELAAMYGRQITCPALVFTQGESGPFDGTYQAKFDQLCTDLRADFAAIFGVAPTIVVTQVGRSEAASGATTVNIELGNVCRARPTEVVLGSVLYDNRTPDGTHGDAEGRAIHGERIGEVICRIVEGGGYTPFQSTSVSRAGATITIDYTVPGADISIDPGIGQPGDGWVKAVTNHGFYYSDNSSGAVVSGVQVATVNGFASRILVTLSADPGAATGKKLVYANTVTDTTVDQWTACRGALRTKLRGSFFEQVTSLVIPRAVWARAAVEEWSV